MKKKIIYYLFIMLILIFPKNIYSIGFEAEETFKSVVVVHTLFSVGSGFAIGNDCIITNAHVIDDSKHVKLSVYMDKEYDADVLIKNSNLDIAVLRIKNKKLKPLEIADYLDLPIGEEVYAIGSPNDMRYTLTKGVLSAKDREMEGKRYIQTDTPINFGNSGGPLLNNNGEVIGVNTLKIFNAEGIGLAIPMQKVEEFLDENQIVIDNNGNLVGEYEYKNIEESQDEDDSNTESGINKNIKTELLYIKIGIGIILFLQILLFIIFAIDKKTKSKTLKKNKKNKKNYNAKKEDYDFEIDIEEL